MTSGEDVAGIPTEVLQHYVQRYGGLTTAQLILLREAYASVSLDRGGEVGTYAV